VLGVSAAMWLGCLYPDDYVEETREVARPSGGAAPELDAVASNGPYTVQQAWLAGDIPRVGAFEADAYQIDVSSGWLTLHVGRRGGQNFGWAMTRLEVGLADLAAGTRTPISAVACSGPTHGDWDWDESTDDVFVHVERGERENERIVYFETGYGREGQTRGGFTVIIH
jgi:hypothetical protein